MFDCLSNHLRCCCRLVGTVAIAEFSPGVSENYFSPARDKNGPRIIGKREGKYNRSAMIYMGELTSETVCKCNSSLYHAAFMLISRVTQIR